ncbi:MAG: hypothetical protein AAFR22_07480, partial [Chloroflexota bacterium]
MRTLLLVTAMLLLLYPAALGAQSDAYQPFENGHMIWDHTTGSVWILTNTGQATHYPESTYRNLPDDPVTEQPPAGRVSPVSGFGRVWGNFDTVRTQLGWATGTERNIVFNLRDTAPTAGRFSQQRAQLPEGQQIVIRSDGTWGPHGVPREINSLPATSSFPASFQMFENGYMLWWSETGTIWALSNRGSITRYNSLAYGALPANPIRGAAPAGKLKPAAGFGKVWGNFPVVRSELGWATQHEVSY